MLPKRDWLGVRSRLAGSTCRPRLPVGVLHDEPLLNLADGSGRGEAAGHSAFYLRYIHIDAAGFDNGSDSPNEI